MIALKEPQITYCEGSALLRCLFHLYLPKSRFEIQAGKMSGTHQALQHLLYSWERVGILLCVGVQAAEVDTKMQAAIFLPYQHHSIAPLTLAGSDSTSFQHSFQVIPNLLNQWWWNSSKLLFKESVISYFYYMFCGMGTAELHWI